MLKVWTAQFRYKGDDRLDITVKTGNKAFSPVWSMVMGHKNGTLTDEQYTDLYIKRMRYSYKKYGDEWAKLLQMEEVTLVCFCKAHDFCHRYLLADILVKCGAKYMGEKTLETRIDKEQKQ